MNRKNPVPNGFFKYAVENIRRFIEIDGEKYASYFAHGYARYLPVSAEHLLQEAKSPAPQQDGHMQ